MSTIMAVQKLGISDTAELVKSVNVRAVSNVVAPKKRLQSPRSHRWFQSEALIICALLLLFGSVGAGSFLYIDTFVRADQESRDIEAVNDQLKAATSEHDNLIRSIAQLTATNTLSQKISPMHMLLSAANAEYIDTTTVKEPLGRREIASAAL